MSLLLKLHLSSYVTRNAQDFSITANVIVLFLLWVMNDVILTLRLPRVLVPTSDTPVTHDSLDQEA